MTEKKSPSLAWMIGVIVAIAAAVAAVAYFVSRYCCFNDYDDEMYFDDFEDDDEMPDNIIDFAPDAPTDD